MDYKGIVRRGYDAVSGVYLAARQARSSADLEALEHLVALLAPGALVLDAGCGAGVPVTLRLSEVFDVVGVDFSEEQLRLARELVPKARFICRDMTELDFPEETYDAVCSYYAIIHVPREEHRGLLRGFHRMLKPSGLLLISMGTSDSPVDIDADFLGTEMYWSHFDMETNERMLEECGFSIIWKRMVSEGPEFGGGRHPFFLARKGPLSSHS